MMHNIAVLLPDFIDHNDWDWINPDPNPENSKA
jgi:hypothetical protein